MSSTTSNEIPQWFRRPLCRRYACVQLEGFQVLVLQEGRPRQLRWYWAFAMFAADEFEVLGAWPADTGAVEPITESLRDRGVLSIRVVSIAAAKGCASPISPESWGIALRDAKPRVLEFVRSESVSGDAIEGVPSDAIRLTLDRAGRIHDGLVRGARPRAPFASAAAASEFIAGWLQKADRRLHEVRRPTKPVVAHTA